MKRSILGISYLSEPNISGNIVPATDNESDLGTPTKKFRSLYVSESVSSESAILDSLKVGGNVDRSDPAFVFSIKAGLNEVNGSSHLATFHDSTGAQKYHLWIHSNGALTWTQTDVADGRLSMLNGKLGINRTPDQLASNLRDFQVDGDMWLDGILESNNTTDATNLNTGAFYTFGGGSIAKKLYVGTSLNTNAINNRTAVPLVITASKHSLQILN